MKKHVFLEHIWLAVNPFAWFGPNQNILNGFRAARPADPGRGRWRGEIDRGFGG